MAWDLTAAWKTEIIIHKIGQKLGFDNTKYKESSQTAVKKRDPTIIHQPSEDPVNMDLIVDEIRTNRDNTSRR